MKKTFLDRAASYRRSGDLLQANRIDRLAQESLDEQVEDVLFALARRIEDEPSNTELYIERAKHYFDHGDPGSEEWEQAERDLARAIEAASNDALLAEAHATRAFLRQCNHAVEREQILFDLQQAIAHGATNPALFKDLAEHYGDLAEDDDVDRIGEAISLYIAGIYYDLRHDLDECGRAWTDHFGLIAALAATYEQRAKILRGRGKPVEAFEDDDKAGWLRREGRQVLQEMNHDSDDIEFPLRIAADCSLL